MRHPFGDALDIENRDDRSSDTSTVVLDRGVITYANEPVDFATAVFVAAFDVVMHTFGQGGSA